VNAACTHTTAPVLLVVPHGLKAADTMQATALWEAAV
jgi:hypothetical protein